MLELVFITWVRFAHSRPDIFEDTSTRVFVVRGQGPTKEGRKEEIAASIFIWLPPNLVAHNRHGVLCGRVFAKSTGHGKHGDVIVSVVRFVGGRGLAPGTGDVRPPLAPD